MKKENSILFIFSFIIVALILATFLSVRSINQFSQNSKLVTHTLDVTTLLLENRSNMQDIETGTRGFVITGEMKYLESYNSGVSIIQANLVKLENLTKDNPTQQLRIDTLKQVINQSLASSKEIIDFRQKYGFEAAKATITDEESKNLMDEIRAIIFRMQMEQEGLLMERTLVTNNSLGRTQLIIISTGILSILVVISLMFFIRRAKKLENQLIKAKEYAEQLAIAKDQFLASMSHEIRTPLNGIIGFTKILLRNKTTEIQRPQLEAIKTSSDILLVLINDILDLAKIEAGKMAIESTELKLSDLVNSILDTFELRFQEKELKLNKQYDNSIPKILLGDPVRINQILLNLLSNSVKFTENGGQIDFNVNIFKQDDEKIYIEFIVSDTGIGISTEKLETIFEPFTQSGSDTARRYGGTGLGLSIVKQLVGLMGGTISVKSQEFQGSTFTVTLPLLKTNATEISKEIEKNIHLDDLKRLGKLKVLLVEDIPVNQFLAQTILQDFGFEIDTAENGKIAIEFIEKNHYDVVLMDLMMPEMNGFETAQYIRTQMQPPKSTIPIIALTADVTKRDMDKCKEAGMDEYVSKPINETNLLHKIVCLVKKHEEIQPKHQVLEDIKICNFDYLKNLSPNNQKFFTEMIEMLLKQTPEYLTEMERCLVAKDWEGFHGSTHKMRPSIEFLSMPKEISNAAKQMDEYAADLKNLELIPDLFLQVQKAFHQAYKELEEELNNHASIAIEAQHPV